MFGSFLGKIYSYYNFLIKPKIKSLRGAEFINRKLARFANIFQENISEEPTNVLDKKWDRLIILDACRYDVYSDLFPEAKKIISVGSHTREFLENTFRKIPKTKLIYVSFNPHIHPLKLKKILKHPINKYFEDLFTLDNYENPIEPENTFKEALKAERIYPDKKKIIHFMQPHEPYLHLENKWGVKEVLRGKKTKEELKEAYLKNLREVLKYVEKLKEKLNGKIVITADHGEFLGEYNMYNHPYGIKAKEVREVPWHVSTSKEHQGIKSEVREIDI